MAANLKDHLGQKVLPTSSFDLARSEKGMATPFAGTTIVVTGKLKCFTRSMIHAKIESLGVKILTEVEFLEIVHQYH